MDLPLPAWLMVAFVIGTAMFGVIHAISCAVRNEKDTHLLRIEVINLQNTYIRHLRRLRGEYDVDVDLVDQDADDPPADVVATVDPLDPVQPVEPAEEDQRRAA